MHPQTQSTNYSQNHMKYKMDNILSYKGIISKFRRIDIIKISYLNQMQ